MCTDHCSTNSGKGNHYEKKLITENLCFLSVFCHFSWKCRPGVFRHRLHPQACQKIKKCRGILHRHHYLLFYRRAEVDQCQKSLLYVYKAKKNAKYYKPLYYLTGSWLANNKNNITVHLGESRSKSVSSIVSANLGVSSPNVSLATSISRNYSSTVSSSYTTDYTFVMKNYSTVYYYRPALFGNILKYGVVRRHRFLKRASIMYSYTFDREAGLYLKLAKR